MSNYQQQVSFVLHLLPYSFQLTAIMQSLVFLFVSYLLHLCSTSKAQDTFFCDSSSKYTSGSAYQQNLNLTLTSLAANASLFSYYISTVGQTPNVVYGLIDCPEYIPKEACQNCASSASTKIMQLCPNQMAAYLWFDNCSLQYSDLQFFSTADIVPRLCAVNTQNANDSVLFNSQMGNMLKSISSTAAADPSRFAVGRTSYIDFVDIYGMVQCNRNLTANDCLRCLQNIISFIPQCSNRTVGARIYAISCNIRYEIYSFFPLSLLPISPLPSPPPPNPSSLPPLPPPLLQPNATSNDGKSSKSIVIVISSIAVTLLVVMAVVFGCFVWNKGRTERVGNLVHSSKNDNNRTCSDGVDEEAATMESVLFGFNTLKEATGNFCDEYKLGEGGFGTVYQGKLPDGREIAVKRLSSSSVQGFQELKTEVMLVAKLLHRNLVRLLGFCLENEEKLLVYEYLPNGSLDKFLFDQNRRSRLEWERRHRIIIGIARGLLYLHEDSQLRIIHRDLKASNILLDESMNPKISDFGLARLFSGSQTQGNTNRIAGTFGYMAPEYAKNGHFSTKSDVYSFGIMVLEIVTGQKSSSFRGSMNLQSYAWRQWANVTAMELLDPALGGQCVENEVLKCIHIGLLCVQEAVACRPTMSEILMMLSGHAKTSPAPSRPGFFISGENSGSDSITQEFVAAQLTEQSINEVSITELDAR